MSSDCATCDSQKAPRVDAKKNNVQKPCPMRMSDGRQFTDYRTRCAIAYQMRKTNAFESSYDQRQFLIKNASSLMQENTKFAETLNECGSCFPKSADGTMLPEQNMVTCNSKTCNFNTVNPSGLGTGRNYSG